MESLKARGCCKERQLGVNDENLERIDSYFGGCSKLESYDWLREVKDQDIPEGLKLTALIQKALQEHKITTKNINLALPAKDLIFRSFTIPWMQAHEVNNVVEFEAIKYIPIKLH